MNHPFLFLLLWIVCILLEVKPTSEDQYHYDNDQKKNPSEQNILNIHIVPHTHDDVGWLKTVEQYYYGQNNTIRHACVSCILDSVIYALQRNPERKFTYVEMAFFSMWWEEQSEDMKEITRNLVKNGQLSFANGGWCMHDEATTHFMGMIDQTTLGHDFLKREFDYVPTVGWQLDPFGHSATQASLLTSEVGFNAIYLGRIDYQDLQNRYRNRSCEGIWDSSPNLRNNAVFWGLTGSFNGNYGAPEGFCFDILCDDDPLFGMNGNDLYQRVLDFLKSVKQQTERTKGNNVMLTMGSDFQFENAMFNFKSLDLLIEQINAIDRDTILELFPNFHGVKAFYSNPEIYTKHRWIEYNRETEENSLEIKYDDFFPYSDCDHCFWTGYFTSRPALKRLERVGSSFLHAVRQVQTLYGDGVSGFKEIELLEKGVAIAQHHDGVSGTSKQHVAYDYAKKIQEGINEASSFMASALKSAMFGGEAKFHDLQYCQLRNESLCEISQVESQYAAGSFYIIVYNALGQKRSDILSIPVSTNSTYVVQRYTGTGENEGTLVNLQSAVAPNFNYAKIPGSAPFNLLIDINDLKAVSPTLVKISYESKDLFKYQPIATNAQRYLRPISFSRNDDFVVRQGNTEVQFVSGTISRLSNKYGSLEVKSEWGYYKSWSKYPDKVNSFFAEPASGAYIFRPDTPNARYHILDPVPSDIYVFESDIATEVHTTFEGSWIHQITKIYKQKDYVDIDFTVGPIPIDDGVGKEVVHRIRTNITNNGTFYTDSNGREFIKRQRSERQTWSLREFEPVAGNYYPVNTAMYIEDDVLSASILTDRSKGGSSLMDGSMELMVHRRIIVDDSRGVGEALNETDSVSPYPPFGDASRLGEGLIVTGTHRFYIGHNKSGAKIARKEMNRMFSPLIVFAGGMSQNRTEWKSINECIHIGEMPSNLQLLTLKLIKSMRDNTKHVLLRLGHAYGKDECKTNSVAIQVNLKELFPTYDVLSVTEMTLTGNQKKDERERTKVKWLNSDNDNAETTGELPFVRIGPMEIKTFRIILRNR